ncbi:MAG: DMT family transporter [Paraglaciecola sp.]|uniref:DMT family transporter n=1 Tax=Paraglaciecola sp. TaxID=1920173 RepID=UPI00273F47F5|nr:DMT family transporter [Paraglaciecola sp.]MDP5030370.1 DMT family transporter [Paraglaciecola sp.]MDP5132249.1 DMT family transporter [Paraglaciecola sp.]
MHTEQARHSFVSALLLAFAGTFLFSMKPILVKQVYLLGIDSNQLITLRMLFAAPIYLAVGAMLWRKNPQLQPAYKSNAAMILVLGVLGYYVASFLDLWALQYISAQLERVVLFCFPTLVVLLSRWVFNTALPRHIWGILALSYAGILLIFAHDMVTFGNEVLFGTTLVFISAVSFAIYTLWSKPLIGKVGSLMFTCIAMISASLFILFHFALSHSFEDLQVGNDALLLCAAIALFATVIPSFLVAEAINRMGPERTSVVGTCGPVITSIVAVLWLDESFTYYHLAGLSLVMLAVWLMIKKP